MAGGIAASLGLPTEAGLPPKARAARLLWAMLLSLFTAGLGHLYLGARRAGLRLIAAEAALDVAGSLLLHLRPGAATVVAMAFVLIAVIALRLAAVALVARLEMPQGSLRKPRTVHTAWFAFLCLLGLTWGAGLALPAQMRSFSIPSGSMIPSLQIGDRVFAATDPAPPARGDIVYFNAPDRPGIIYVKRVIGLGGDRVQLRGGDVWLNGQKLARTALAAAGSFRETLPDGRGYDILKTAGHGPLDDTAELTVPPGAMFVLGDNRDNSLDSRAPAIGAVPVAAIVGHGGVIYWAADRGRILAAVR